MRTAVLGRKMPVSNPAPPIREEDVAVREVLVDTNEIRRYLRHIPTGIEVSGRITLAREWKGRWGLRRSTKWLERYLLQELQRQVNEEHHAKTPVRAGLPQNGRVGAASHRKVDRPLGTVRRHRRGIPARMQG